MSRILVVEDDRMLNQGISFNLQMDGFEVVSALTLKEGQAAIEADNIDMIILDANLPDGSGFEFCKKVRRKYDMPIVFLTACDMELDIITGLRYGADDYITKPFSLNILRERVFTLFRRYNATFRRYNATQKISNTLTLGDFEFDFDKMTVTKNGENIVLAPTEYKILKKLVIYRGEVLTRQALLEDIWDNDEFIEEHALTVNINRLRSKIEDSNSKGKYIKTVYGIGYTWAGEE